MSIFYLRVEVPLVNSPPAIQRIDRWYQMDGPSQALAALGVQVLEFPRPDAIVLASLQGCNEADEFFRATQMTSPQRFVHTLPSVRLSPLCQLLQWEGPALCLQNGRREMGNALREALDLRAVFPHLWCLGVAKRENAVYDAVLLDLTAESEETCRRLLDYDDLPFWERVQATKGI